MIITKFLEVLMKIILYIFNFISWSQITTSAKPCIVGCYKKNFTSSVLRSSN